MAAPSIRGSTAPVAGLSTTSPSGTAVGDLVVVATWERSGAGSPTHTLQANYREARTHAHDDGSTDGRMSVAITYARTAGAQTYQAYTTSGSGTVYTACIVYQAGTYNPNDLVVNSQTTTNNAAPDPASVTGLTGDWSVMAFAGWHLSASTTVAVSAPTNYTEQWEIAGSADVEFSLATRALTGLSGSTENPGAFTDDVAPNGSCTITIALGYPVEPSIYEVAAASSGTGAITPTMATHGTTAGWIVYVIVQTANQPTTLSTANGFVERTDMRVGTGTPGAAGAVGLQVFYQRAAGSTLSSPTVADSGDHTIVQCVSTKDNWIDGNPWDAIATATYASSTAATAPSVTTQVPGCVVHRIIGNALDTTGNQGSSWTNANPEGFAQASDGVGGGFNIGGSAFASAGATGTAGLTLASASVQASISFAVCNSFTPGIQQQITASPAAASASTQPTPVLYDGALRPSPATASAGTNPTPSLTPGAVTTTPAPATASASTQPTPVVTDTVLSIGAHGLDFQLFGHGNGPSSVTLTTTSGSMLLAFWGGATTDLATAPTDNKGNTFRRIGSVEGYPTYPQWATSVWAAYNITGGSSHTIEAICEDFEESTLVVVEVVGGKIVRSVGYAELSMNTPSTSHVGPNVTATSAAIEFQIWWGESAVGQDHTASPNNGLAVIESYLTDHPDGYIQNATAWAAKTAGTHGVTWTISPSQGFACWGLIVQGEERLPVVESTAVAVTPNVLGNQSVDAAPSAATASAVTPALAAGGVSVAPAPAASTAAAVTPSLTAGAATTTPAPATATAPGVDPTFTAGAVSTAPAPAAATASAVTPALAATNTVTASPASSTANGVDPALTPGAVSVTPAAISSTAAPVTPTLTAGSVSTTPAPAMATSAGVDPTLGAGSVSTAAAAAASTAVAITPAIEPGSVSVGPAPAVATAAAVTPTTLTGDYLSASPATAAASSITPTLAAGAVSITAAPAGASAAAADPALTPGAAPIAPGPALASAIVVDPAIANTVTPITAAPATASASAVTPQLFIAVELPALSRLHAVDDHRVIVESPGPTLTVVDSVRALVPVEAGTLRCDDDVLRLIED